MKILVTGAAGKTALAILNTLAAVNYDITGFDLPGKKYDSSVYPLLQKRLRGDVRNFQSIRSATAGMDAIIHLAVAEDEVAYIDADIPFATNVRGTYHVFEAARRHHIEKVILLSSAAVHTFIPENIRLSALTDWISSKDDNYLYDLTKRLQEEIAKDFSATFCMNVIVLRAGHIVDGILDQDLKGNPLANLAYCRGGWVCRYDVATACLKALEMSTKYYQAYHIIGAKQAERQFDIKRTEKELGLSFTQRFESYL